jgi:hypothetical protein
MLCYIHRVITDEIALPSGMAYLSEVVTLYLSNNYVRALEITLLSLTDCTRTNSSMERYR